MIVNEWIVLFQEAIASYDTHKIHSLLHTLPSCKTHEELTSILLLSMDAEVMLCELRQKLTDKRTDIMAQIV